MHIATPIVSGHLGGGGGGRSALSRCNCLRFFRAATRVRFQITNIYMLRYLDPATWSEPRYVEEYPFARDKWLTDIVHCPGKTGYATCEVLDMQFASKGLSRYDAAHGVGDGGGENEGVMDGVHTHMRNAEPSYVHRRCLHHVPWRTGKAGMDEMGQLVPTTKAISTYTRDGVTWSRLKAIAVSPIARGGLALLACPSVRYSQVFDLSPPSIIEDRPESFAVFLEWLIKREDVLVLCVGHDVAARNLRMADATTALQALQSRQSCYLRSIASILMAKSMFLHHWTSKWNYVAAHESFSDLVKRAADIVTDLSVDDTVLKHLGITRDEYDALPAHHANWIEVSCMSVPGGNAAENDEMVPICLEFHKRVATRMSSHLTLTVLNMNRSHWLSAQIVSKKPQVARAGARLFHDHLVRLRDDQMSEYEAAFVSDDVLMCQLSAFADYPTPICVWHKGIAFAELFMFIADRFLGAPDSVVDCEGCHAKWQWIMGAKRGIRFKTLNAILKIKAWMQHYGSLPDIGEFDRFLCDVRNIRETVIRSALSDPAVASGQASAQVDNARFNLRPMDMELVRRRIEMRPDAPQTPEVAWGMYVRFLFEAQTFYAFKRLAPNMFLFVGENKSMPNRHTPADDAAIGRHLTVAWFTVAASQNHTSDNSVLVVPCACDGQHLELVASTIAEISKAAGYYPDDITADETERSVELKHEQRLLHHEVVAYSSDRYSYEHGAGCGEKWAFLLHEDPPPEDIEDYCFVRRELQQLTKMALARRIQLTTGCADAHRDALWALPKATLLAQLHGGADVGADGVGGGGGDAGPPGGGGGGVDVGGDVGPPEPGDGGGGGAPAGGVHAGVDGAPPGGRGRGRGRGKAKPAAKPAAKAKARGKAKAKVKA